MFKNNLYRFAGLVLAVMLLAMTVMPTAVRAAGPWYVATTGDDANSCLSPATPCATINGAIGKASSDDTINVAIGTYTGTGDIFSIVVLINKNITLLGGWDATFTIQSGNSIIDGQNARRAVYINSGVAVTLERFEIQGGNNYLGGGGVTIDNNSVVAIQNSTISGNVAQNGGGISVGINATLTLNNSTVSGNTAFYSTAGGIEVYGGSLTVLNSTIVNNTAATNGGGLNVTSSTVSLSNSTVSDNVATSGGGGGMYNSVSSNLILFNVTFADNSANSFNGGGMYNEQTSPQITNTTFIGNSANFGGGMYNN